MPAARLPAIQRSSDPAIHRTGNESMEANWIRTWLDNVFALPWTERSDERLELDADHTGLEEVKDRLIEHLAVRKLKADREAERQAQAEADGDEPDEAAASRAADSSQV